MWTDMAGRRRDGEGPSPIYTPETAAVELGITAEELEELCRRREVLYSDIGPGETPDGVWHEHLYRWTPGMLARVRDELAARP